MKKNRMMRVASALLVAVLLTTCVISGTFAKYVTAEDGADFARVAKWGVDIEAKSFGLFAADYKVDDTSATLEGNYSVSSAGTTNRDDVLAPGTKGEFADIKITGTPEVAVDVAVVPTVSVTGNWVVDGDFYCPVVVTVGDTAICGLAYDKAADFAAAIADEIGGYSAQYDPNKDLTTIDANFDISWEWAFDDADHVALACDCEAGAQKDTLDTKLGNVAVAANAGEELKINIGVEITVTQID